MGKSKHNKLPWRLDGPARIVDADGKAVCCNGRGGNSREFIEQGDANMALIVACVNALAGLNPGAVEELVKAAKKAVAANLAGEPDLYELAHNQMVTAMGNLKES